MINGGTNLCRDDLVLFEFLAVDGNGRLLLEGSTPFLADILIDYSSIILVGEEECLWEKKFEVVFKLA
jgi:hypothetical protein